MERSGSPPQTEDARYGGLPHISGRYLGICISIEQSTAIIITDEIHSRAADDFTNPGDHLGLVMAHEMGHLLLRSPLTPLTASCKQGLQQA